MGSQGVLAVLVASRFRVPGLRLRLRRDAAQIVMASCNVKGFEQKLPSLQRATNKPPSLGGIRAFMLRGVNASGRLICRGSLHLEPQSIAALDQVTAAEILMRSSHEKLPRAPLRT